MQKNVEALARHVYRLAGYSENWRAWPPELATRVLGDDSIVYAPQLHAEGILTFFDGGWRILVRPSLTKRRLAHVVGHELGHWICRKEGVVDDEALCDAIGAAIIAPRTAYLAKLHRAGPRLRELAWAFDTTESLAALRYAEVTGAPLALITPDSVRVRGHASDWPPENEIRQLARSGGGGLWRLQLRDDPRRIVLTSCAELSI